MKALEMKVFEAFDKDWALVTAGTPEHFNTMTISWGGLGTLWGKRVATVYVKPLRYTHSFLDANEYFTLSFFAPEHRPALGLLGSRSGRDGDKVGQSGLHAKALGASVGFEEARLTLLCKKIYRQDMILETMPPEAVETYYREEAPHTMFIGEVLDILE